MKITSLIVGIGGIIISFSMGDKIVLSDPFTNDCALFLFSLYLVIRATDDL